MNITKLTVENIMRVSAVEITPKGNVIVIGGNNGNGKSSVLSAIEMALGGKGRAVDQPVRAGSESGRITIDLGDIAVERTFRQGGGTSLRVKAANGAVFPSPQSMLDHMIGKLTFDPLDFARSAPKKQAEILRQITGVDTSDLEAERAKIYTQRTDLGRLVDQKTASLKTLAPLPVDIEIPDSEPDVSRLMRELNLLQTRNEARRETASVTARKQAESDHAKQQLEHARANVDYLEQNLAKARLDEERKVALSVAADDALNRARDVQREVEAQIESDADIRLQIVESQKIGELVRRKKSIADLNAETARLNALVDGITQRLAAIDGEKKARISAANFPVEGLRFDEDVVTFNGIPFTQSSSAEQLRVSVAIGLALNPKLRVMIVRDGSLLDENGLTLLADLAKEANAQVWVERVGKGEEVSFVIEDGRYIESDRECNTCDGSGKIDLHLGGKGHEDIAPCPDCR